MFKCIIFSMEAFLPVPAAFRFQAVSLRIVLSGTHNPLPDEASSCALSLPFSPHLWVFNQSLMRWLKQRARTYLRRARSRGGPRRRRTAPGEGPFQKCVAVSPMQRFTFVLKNRSLEIVQACVSESLCLELPVVRTCR